MMNTYNHKVNSTDNRIKPFGVFNKPIRLMNLLGDTQKRKWSLIRQFGGNRVFLYA